MAASSKKKLEEDKIEDDPKIKYLIKTRNEEFVIEISKAWKVTFSSVNPASMHGRTDGYCVRIYEMPGSHLRAVFDSVISIRDMSIPLARKIKAEVSESRWTSDSLGNFSRETSAQVTFELVEENLT